MAPLVQRTVDNLSPTVFHLLMKIQIEMQQSEALVVEKGGSRISLFLCRTEDWIRMNFLFLNFPLNREYRIRKKLLLLKDCGEFRSLKYTLRMPI